MKLEEAQKLKAIIDEMVEKPEEKSENTKNTKELEKEEIIGKEISAEKPKEQSTQ